MTRVLHAYETQGIVIYNESACRICSAHFTQTLSPILSETKDQPQLLAFWGVRRNHGEGSACLKGVSCQLIRCRLSFLSIARLHHCHGSNGRVPK